MKNTTTQASHAGRGNNDRPVVFLMGPTACGKTDLAAALCDEYEAELVSVDAAQVYRGMDIGTAKPAREFLRNYPHHLIDIRNPGEAYNAASFRADALALIGEIRARGKLPILTGGTMFYFSALEHGLSELPSDPESRAHIDREIEQHGLEVMHARLRRIDPALAAKIPPSDTQRIRRALEIHRLTKLPPSAAMVQSIATPLDFPPLKLGLFTADRRALHARIEARFNLMIKQGLVDEVKTIIAGLDRPDKHSCLRTVGYRQVHGYLKGEFPHDQMLDKGIAATRQLAKRQLTWMRQQKNLVWVENTGGGGIDGVGAYLKSRLGVAG